MIISKTPLRISFVGGGTDLPQFYTNDYGAVLSSTIDKYVYVMIKERFDDLIVLNWSKKEIVENIDDIEHELIREAMRKTGIEKAVEITTIADIPSEGSGLGSSSSLTVGLLNACYAFRGIHTSTEKLAEEACEIEIDRLGKPIGKQDQYAAAYGGVNEIVFHKDGRVKVNKVNFQNQKMRVLGSNLLLFYTGMTRKSETILKKQTETIRSKFDILKKMRDQVPLLKKCLENGNEKALGDFLNENWSLKKTFTSSITNKKIDDMYEEALKAGASGGKISGAGGGGFLLIYVPREKQNSVREALKDHRELPFMIDRIGTRIIFNQMSDYWR